MFCPENGAPVADKLGQIPANDQDDQCTDQNVRFTDHIVDNLLEIINGLFSCLGRSLAVVVETKICIRSLLF